MNSLVVFILFNIILLRFLLKKVLSSPHIYIFFIIKLLFFIFYLNKCCCNQVFFFHPSFPCKGQPRFVLFKKKMKNENPTPPLPPKQCRWLAARLSGCHLLARLGKQVTRIEHLQLHLVARSGHLVAQRLFFLIFFWPRFAISYY